METKKPSLMEQWVDRYAMQPLLYVQEVHGVDPDPCQLEIIEAYRRAIQPNATPKEKRISIVSGHGVGKSAALSWIADHHQTFFFPQRVAMTAPTGKQMFDVLYNEVVMWMKRKPKEIFELHEVKSDVIELKAAPEDSFLTAKTASIEKPEALSGVHSDHVLLLIDEASAVSDVIFENAAGSLSGHNCIVIMASNGTRSSGYFYDSHHKMKDYWTTFSFSCEDSPRVSKDWIAMMAAKYGRESNVFRVRVLGQFPRADEDTIIPREVIENAQLREIVPDPKVAPVWGLMPGWRSRAVLAKRRGRVLLEAPKTYGGYEASQIVAAVQHEWLTTAPGDRPADIIVHAIGEGGIIADRLRALGLPARSINIAEHPAMKGQFPDLRTELWFDMKAWFMARDVAIPPCREGSILGDVMLELVEELASQRHDKPTATGKIRATEPKKMEAHIGRFPDLSDALALTFAGNATTAAGVQSGNREPIRRNIKGLV
jgi:phage terminase large subunit